jgi:phosphatidylglycerol:prolipoprotein diacylglycerol transferase
MIIQGQKTGWDAFFSVGFVFYGALIGLSAGIFLESKRRGKPVLIYTDAFFRLLPLGQAIGRIGCYFNGCCYGAESNSWIAIPYIIGDIHVTVIPTQFIEAAFCLILAVAFLFWQTEKQGRYTFIYLSAYAVFRFVLEFFRGDEIRGLWFGLSTSQWISISMMIIATIGGVKLIRKKNSNYA